MTHRLTLSPRRAAVLRWAEREVSSDLVAVWSPEDKQTLAGMVADGLILPTGSRYLLTPDGVKALKMAVRMPPGTTYSFGFPQVTFDERGLTVAQLQQFIDGTLDVAADFPPSDPDL